ncbi:MAG: hypothetical protein J6A03_03740 [Lachnospiraceae bacterium]|nr:hypothetical protein [Lachnospiraceae bacterium]
MQKPTILYASPFNPMQSGISDYSEVLVKALQEKYDITLLVRGYRLSNQQLTESCKVLDYDRDTIPYHSFDYIIYNIGNQPAYHDYIYQCCLEHPGLIILHDFSLYFLFVGVHGYKGDFMGAIYELEGAKGIHRIKDTVRKEHHGLLECKNLPSVMPLNHEILQSGNKIMVHSEYTYHKIMETGYVKEENVRKINHIALVDNTTDYMSKEELFALYNIPNDAIILASFGFISNTKLNHVVCKVISKLASQLEQKVCYVMVGEGTYVDEYVDDKVIFKTGYTELIEFNSFIKYSDIIINLRHPSMGETSGALIRILGLGKVCMISDEGWFAEIPDECAIKVRMNGIDQTLEDKITELIQYPEKRMEYEKNAKNYISSEYSGEIIVHQIADFLDS